MSITAVSTGDVALQTRRKAESAIQGVFSSILAAAGETGFASATPQPAKAATGADLKQAWQDWLTATAPLRQQGSQSVQASEEYQNLLLKAHAANAYAAPQAFLQQLDSAALATLQHANNLAQPIDVNGLTLEGALNLLIPAPAQVDRNGDGLTQTGAGSTLRFPDSRTPANVADAWHEATADLPPGERMTRELQMKFEIVTANLRLNERSEYVRTIEPGDPEFVNPQAAPGYSYLAKVRQTLDSIEYFKNQTKPEQYASDKSFWTAFRDALIKHEVP